MPPSESVCGELSGMVLRVAGEVGQGCLARSGDLAGARAAVDQHVAEIRDALGGDGQEVTVGALLRYTQGFTEAALSRGWVPVRWHERDPWDDEAPLDWESLRLAAACRLFIETQGLGRTA